MKRSSITNHKVDAFFDKIEAAKRVAKAAKAPLSKYRYGCVCGVVIKDPEATNCPYCKRKIEKPLYLEADKQHLHENHAGFDDAGMSGSFEAGE